ncbi:universal stress protein [Thalassococcus sp. S3]|uniref:universal stress protein n=1 Tax=Thalassococcus sp. S3 TaxID=2017482 RepID=UPI00102474F2|nr:universal stress protein [Thalassococcus sp. S3]QBF30325.1 universal stress protein [Thalassococcus sp. S3]
MAYKSLLTVLTDESLADGPLEHIGALAQAWDAHAMALCLGVDRTQTGYYTVGASTSILQDSIVRAAAEAETLRKLAEARLGAQNIRWSVEEDVAQLLDLGRHVALHARFSDLVLLPQPYGDNRGIEVEAVVEAALFNAPAPILVVPDDSTPLSAPDTVIVAWNESAESLAAIRAALPIMQRAKQVRVVVIDPPQHGPERSDPGGMLSQMLARHGIHCEIDVLSRTMPRIADVLNRHAGDTNADMIVMGAYGHSRFREALLGGATRDMLECATVPVLMSR